MVVKNPVIGSQVIRNDLSLSPYVIFSISCVTFSILLWDFKTSGLEISYKSAIVFMPLHCFHIFSVISLI